MMALGRFYAMDFSPDYDPVKAYKWYSLARLMGDVDANAHRDDVAPDLTPEQVNEANAQIELWSNSNAELLAQQH
jgi:TPR repeat protein